MNKEKYFIDLSKCTHNEIMELFSLTRGNYKVVGSSVILHMVDSEWVTTTNAVDKTELLYPDFIKLFEGGEGEKTDTETLIEKLEAEKKELLEALENVKGYLGSDVRNEIESLIQKMKQ